MWNVPNVLTMCRFLLVPVYCLIFISGYWKWALAVLLLAGLTDVLDGYIARKRNLVTELGSMLDPLADKLMMIAVVLTLVFSKMLSWEAAAAFFLRDAGMIAGSAYFHFRGKRTVPANSLGKLTTVLYYAAVLLIVLDFPYAHEYFWFVIGVSVLTSFFYIIQFAHLNRKSEKA